MGEKGEGETVKSRILLLLLYYTPFLDKFLCPRELTQDGIAERLGKGRGHIASEIKDLKENEEVAYRLVHTKNAKTMRKGFYLTPKGVQHAMQISEKIRDEEADAAIGENGGESNNVGREPRRPAPASA